MSECKITPKQWVLVRDDKGDEWTLCQYSHLDGGNTNYRHVVCGGNKYMDCIPYEGNEHLLGHTDDYVEPYVPKDGDFVTYTYPNGNKYVAIYQCTDSNLIDIYYVDICLKNNVEGFIKVSYDNGFDRGYSERRQSTDEEKNQLLSKLHKIGKDWNAEKKEVVAIVPPFVPKDGDFVKDVDDSIFVYKESKTACFADCYVGYTEGDVDLVLDIEGYTDKNTLRPATEKDKEWFIQKMHDFGNDWDAEKKEVVDWKWEPCEGEAYYHPKYNIIRRSFVLGESLWVNDSVDCMRKEINHVFCSKEECQVMCDKLNEAIKDVK